MSASNAISLPTPTAGGPPSTSAVASPVNGNSTSYAISTALPAPSAMTNEQLALELSSLFSLSVAVLLRAAEIVRELRRRNTTVQIRSVLFGEYVPAIADGHLAAECVSNLADAPRCLRAVSRLPLADQVRLANGDRIPVLPALDREPQLMSVRQAFESDHTHVILGSRVLNVAEQRTQLAAKVKAGAKPKKKAPPKAPKAAAEPVSEEDQDKLIWSLNQFLATSGQKLSPRLFVEFATKKAGWGPRQ